MPHKIRRVSKRVKRLRSHSTSSWKKGRTIRKLLKKVKIFLFALLTVALTSGALYALNAYKLLKTQFSQALEEGIESNIEREVWNGTSSANFLILGAENGILRVNPVLKTYTYFSLPSNFFDSSKGDEDSVKSISKQLGLYFYGNLTLDEKSQVIFKKAVGDYSKGEVFGGNYLSFALSLKENLGEFKDYFKTNLSLKELLDLINAMKKTERAEAVVIDENTLETDYLFDSVFFPKIMDQSISQEALSTMVLNGTSISGLAGKAGRRIKNVGVFTLDPQNSENQFKESFIAYKKDGLQDSNTVSEIKRTLGIKNVLYKENFLEYANYCDRADVLVVLGIDKKEVF